MASIHIAHFAALHLGTERLRNRRGRRLRAVRPSRRNELWYRAQLGAIVDEFRKAGAEIAVALRSTWPIVRDERDPSLPPLLRRAAERFGNIERVAERLTDVADRLSVVRRNLAQVDESLVGAIRSSIGVNVQPLLTAHGEIADEMARAARTNVQLITSIPAQYLDLVRESVDKAFTAGARWESIAARIQEIGDVTENRAKVIARDQTSKMNAAFNEVRQTNLGIEEYIWSGALDQRERASHRAMEGTVQRWDSPPLVDGERVHAGEAILCRCVGIPRINLDSPALGGGQASQQEAQAA